MMKRSERLERRSEKEKRAERKGRGPLHSIGLKIVAFMVLILFVITTVLSVVGAAVMFDNGVYVTSPQALREDSFFGEANGIAYYVVNRVTKGINDQAREYLEYRNISTVTVKHTELDSPLFSFDSGMEAGEYVIDCVWASVTDDNGRADWYSIDTDAIDDERYEEYNIYIVTLTLSKEFVYEDVFFWYDLALGIIHSLRYWVYPIGLASLLLAVLSFIFLICSAGRRPGKEGVSASFSTGLPFDLFTALMVIFFVGGMYFADSLNNYWETVFLCVFGLVFFVLLTLWCMSLALRIKLGVLLRYNLIYMILSLIWKAVCAVFGFFRTVLVGIPFVWKTAILLTVCAVVEIVVLLLSNTHGAFALIFWCLSKITVYPAIIYFALMLHRLKVGANEIASGNTDHKIATGGLFLDLRDHAETLNRIGDGMNLAIEERIKGERMKTELITNVSHDIKTPLTSIINYSDLICREECDNPRITEYAEVLHRQSVRMKRLIEDLVEASKASSGNIDVDLSECDACVFVAQASGEYEQKLSGAGLELVTVVPEKQVKILADGRRLWRVFDNLMNNIAKYALGGTRVYLLLEEREGRAVFSFKNISRDPLSVSADELTERFVRGDASRNTEGNGLGLSIAKSLTELQGGTLEITTDGDLFKVEVSFAII